MVEAGFAQVGDDVPVAREVDGVAQGLIDGRQLAAREGPVERIARPLALDGGHVLGLDAGKGEAAQRAVGELALDLDERLAFEIISIGAAGGTDVAEHAAEDVAQEIGQQFGLFQRLGFVRAEEIGPVSEPGAGFGDGGRQGEGLQPGPQGVGTKEELGFGGHERSPGDGGRGRDKTNIIVSYSIRHMESDHVPLVPRPPVSPFGLPRAVALIVLTYRHAVPHDGKA